MLVNVIACVLDNLLVIPQSQTNTSKYKMGNSSSRKPNKQQQASCGPEQTGSISSSEVSLKVVC